MDELQTLSQSSRSWPFIEAHKIINKVKRDNKEIINLQTGYGPSGLPHIGTFGEVVRTTMVSNAIKSISNYEVNLITFSDDMDGLRKVPNNIPNQDVLSKNLYKPLTSIPDPFGTHKSFGAHNNGMLQQFLNKFHFKYDFKSSTELYTSGFFDEQLLNVLENYEKVKNLVLPTLGEERRKTYSPFLPICPDSGEVLEVEVKNIDVSNKSIIYEKNNKQHEVLVTGGHCKLQWKVDWAMRWIALNIDYEMYGKDLIPTFQLSSQICKALGGKPPENFFYELFLDQNGEKISKSKGNGLSIDEWLSYAPQETLSYFMYQNPRRAKKLFFEIIPKSTDEFLGHVNKFNEQSITEQIENPVWHIFNGSNDIGNVPISYNLILNLVSASGKDDPQIILDFIKKYTSDLKDQSLVFIKKLIKGVIKYNKEVVSEKVKFKKPNTNELKIFEDLLIRLKKFDSNSDAESIQTEVYQIGKDHNFENLRDWFKLIYQVLFGKEDGPRFGTFAAIYGVDKTIELIEERTKTK